MYLRAWNQRRYYTPQMIVNGRVGFVGSKRQTARQAVSRALQTPARVSLQLKAEALAAEQLVAVNYAVLSPEHQLLLNLALVESELHSPVATGENAGRTLEHYGLVRGFQVESLADGATGEARIRLPDDAELQHCRVIAYAQEPSTLRIVGAARSGPLSN